MQLVDGWLVGQSSESDCLWLVEAGLACILLSLRMRVLGFSIVVGWVEAKLCMLVRKLDFAVTHTAGDGALICILGYLDQLVT